MYLARNTDRIVEGAPRERVGSAAHTRRICDRKRRDRDALRFCQRRPRRAPVITREGAITLLLSIGAALGTAWGVAKVLGLLETGGLP